MVDPSGPRPIYCPWWPFWRHDMVILSTLLAICKGNPPVIGRFPSQSANNAELWWYFPCWYAEKAIELPAVWDAITLLWRHSNGNIGSTIFIIDYHIEAWLNWLPFSNVLSWQKVDVFCLKFHWILFLLIINLHMFRYWPGITILVTQTQWRL